MSGSSPLPSFKFTVPSIHDDLDLDCRIYNPQPSTIFPSAADVPWLPRGAVIAHPYAPLGGSQDDPIVLAVAEECLKKGLVVGTFNFRGAPGSKSSTSWTTQPEINDYISVIGMLTHYLQILSTSLPRSPVPSPALSSTHLTPVPSNTTAPLHLNIPPSPPSTSQPIHLLLSGYSYGALITTLLPSTPCLLQPFTRPHLPSSAVGEILARAHSLATQTLKDLQQSDERRGRRSQGPSSQIAVGGEEGSPGARRLSRDHSRKSIDAVRRSVDHTRRSIERSRRRLWRGSGSEKGEANSDDFQPATPPLSPGGYQAPDLHTCYLLISPLLGPLAGFMTLSLSTVYHSLIPRSSASNSTAHYLPTPNHKHNNPTNTDRHLLPLSTNPTQILYGSTDLFTSAKRLRRWCASLAQQARQDGKGVVVQSREVEGAGHFWREKGVEGVLRGEIMAWLDGLWGTGGEVKVKEEAVDVKVKSEGDNKIGRS